MDGWFFSDAGYKNLKETNMVVFGLSNGSWMWLRWAEGFGFLNSKIL